MGKSENYQKNRISGHEEAYFGFTNNILSSAYIAKPRFSLFLLISQKIVGIMVFYLTLSAFVYKLISVAGCVGHTGPAGGKKKDEE